jgi:hypothetical protein
MRRDDYVNRIEAFLDRHGITEFHFERRSRHRAVIVTYRGRTTVAVFPTSGRDWRGPRNAVANLRHALDLLARRAAR